MNPSDAFWAPPQFTIHSNYKSVSGHTGFLFNLPFPDPVSTGFVYGDGNQNVFGKRELVYSTLPELQAFGNIIPTTAGHPRVDPNSREARFSRADYTIKV